MRTTGLSGADPLSFLKGMNPDAKVWNRLATTKDDGVRGTAGFPFAPGRLTMANIMLIGDAAGYLEPFSGTGIGMALYSGICAARAIITGSAVARDYTRAMRPHRQAMWRTRILSAALNSDMSGWLLQRTVPRFDNWLSNMVERVHVRSAI